MSASFSLAWMIYPSAASATQRNNDQCVPEAKSQLGKRCQHHPAIQIGHCIYQSYFLIVMVEGRVADDNEKMHHWARKIRLCCPRRPRNTNNSWITIMCCTIKCFGHRWFHANNLFALCLVENKYESFSFLGCAKVSLSPYIRGLP